MTRLLCLTATFLMLFIRPTLSAAEPIDEKAIDRIDSYVNSDPDSAIILCNNALRSLPEQAERERVSLLTIRGNAAFTLGDCGRAIADFADAVRIASETADTTACVNALSDLGVAYRVNQQPDSAMACYNRALAMLEGGNAPDLEANLLTSIAVLFANQGRFSEAVPFAERGLEKARQTDDIETQIYAASSLGSALFLAGDHERSLATQRQIVGVAERKGVPRYILKTYASIIAMHNRLGNADSVRYYIDKGQALLPKVPEASIESIGFMEQSFVVLTAMGRYRESLDIQMKILDMQDARPFMPLDRLWQRIALNYKGLGDLDSMADAYQKAIAIADSIHRSDIDEQISDFNVRYSTAEKELAIATLRAEKSRRDTIIAIITAVIALAAVLLTFYLRSRRRKIQLANIRAQLDGIEQERGRLAHELHDGVCNDLLGIELTLAGRNCDKDELTAMVHSVRSEVRSISHELLPPRFTGVSLSQLLAAYAQKSEGFIKFEGSLPAPSLSPQQSVNLYRIVQEWTSNLRHHSDATAVTVRLSSDPTGVNLSIIDNGSPFSPDKSGGRGLGLENIGRRVKAMQGIWDVVREGSDNIMTVKI